VANESYAKLLPDGLESKDQFLFTIIETASERAVGTLWFAKKAEAAKPHAWVYDIVLNPEVRGRGYGKFLMQLLEAEVKKVGLNSIVLHVFGHNTVASSLYEKSGFRVTNKIMAKDL
jgi:ribosomal protein S18 acetylase RimI-like enzyme